MNKTDFNIAFGNSQGLKNDAEILSGAICYALDKDVRFRYFSGAQGKFQNLLALLKMIYARYVLRRRQITFHLEELYTEISPFSSKNILIPNQEWLRSRTEKAITPDTLIWCKTHYAVRQLQHLNDNVSYLGFTSRDMNDPEIEPDFNKFIHIAGKSEQKGTIPLLRVWSKHLEWPMLSVISRREEHQEFKAENIQLVSRFLGEDELKEIINQHGVHLCPSESEGFGHNIVEAMSTGAVAITTKQGKIINRKSNELLEISPELISLYEKIDLSLRDNSKQYLSKCVS